MIVILAKKIKNMPNIIASIKILLLLLFIITSTFYIILRNKYVTHLQISNQPIQIIRDQHNIPHITAPTFSSILYAWGYVLAQDRLFQLAFRRAMLQGKLSQYAGRKSLHFDKLFRQIGFKQMGQKISTMFYKEDPEQYNAYLNFANGINKFVQDSWILPLDFQLLGLDWRQWTVADIFLIFKAVQWSQAKDAPQQMIRSILLNNHSHFQVTQMFPFNTTQYYPCNSIVQDQELEQQLKKNTISIQETPRFNQQQIQQLVKVGMAQFSAGFGRGSNSWVVSGNLTKTGKPIVANDPHLHNALPGQWYQIQINYQKNGKNISMIGASMTGLPIIVGKTQYAAFGFTTIHGDTLDWYHQKIDVQKETYQLNQKQIPLKKRVEMIKIKGQKDLQHVVYETHRGPIVHHVQHDYDFYYTPQFLSYAWTGYRLHYKSLVSFSHIQQCFDFQCIKKSLIDDSDYGPTMNVIVGTQDNHIGYFAIGPNPIRRNPSQGTWVKSGQTDQYDWIGILQGRQKLRLIDPKKGYIITANNIPGPKSFQNDLFGTGIYTARADRIQHMIKNEIFNNNKFSTEDMMRLQLDTKDFFCYGFILKSLMTLLPQDNLLKDFDCDMQSQSYQASIYQVFFYEYLLLLRPTKDHNIGVSHHFLQYMLRNIFFSNKGDQKSIVINQAYQNSLIKLQKLFKTKDHTKWKWGQIHQSRMIHRPFSQSSILKPLYQRNLPGKGNINTVNVGYMNRLTKGDFGNYHQANLRIIMGFDQKSYYIIDGGSSQKFYSRFYDDQLKIHSQGKYIIMQDSSKINQFKNQESQL